MAISKGAVIGLAAGLLIGAPAGGAGGWYYGAQFLLNDWVREQSGDVTERIAALREAKSYRGQQPRTSQRPMVDQMVHAVLSRDFPGAKK